MIRSKAWNWDVVTNPIWRIPCEESYYYASRWKEKGYSRLLDLGCGLGRHTVFFARQGFSVSAMDLSAEAVHSTQDWLKEEGILGDVKTGDMLSLPYPDAAFDCLFSYHVISHTDTPGVKQIISEIRRVLAPGGEMFLTLCSKDTWSYKDAGFPVIDENSVMKTDGAEVNVPHFYVNLDDLFVLFKGFEIIKVRHTDDCYLDGKVTNSKHYFLLARRL